MIKSDLKMFPKMAQKKTWRNQGKTEGKFFCEREKERLFPKHSEYISVN